MSRVVMEGMESSVPLPAPFRAWARNDALLYRGAVSVLAGPPGCGKTITALNVVDRIGMPTLYISNDSTRYTIAKRVFSMLTGMDAHASADVIEHTPEVASDAFQRWSRVKFEFESSPSVESIALQGEAYREWYGEYPPLTVVDILMNIDMPGIRESQNYWGLFPLLKDIAMEQNTALFGIHHTSESAKYEYCPPKSSVMGKANHLPELIMTQVMRDGEIWYSPVKNRNGDADETGDKHWRQKVDAARCQIEDTFMDDVVFHDGLWVPDNEKVMGDF